MFSRYHGIVVTLHVLLIILVVVAALESPASSSCGLRPIHVYPGTSTPGKS